MSVGVVMGIGWLVVAAGILIREICLKQADGDKLAAAALFLCIVGGFAVIGAVAMFAGSASSLFLSIMLMIAVPSWLLWEHTDGFYEAGYDACYYLFTMFALPCSVIFPFSDLINSSSGYYRLDTGVFLISTATLIIMAVMGRSWKRNNMAEIEVYREQLNDPAFEPSDGLLLFVWQHTLKNPKEVKLNTDPFDRDQAMQIWEKKTESERVNTMFMAAHYRNGHPLSIFDEVLEGNSADVSDRWSEYDPDADLKCAPGDEFEYGPDGEEDTDYPGEAEGRKDPAFLEYLQQLENWKIDEESEEPEDDPDDKG